MITIAKPEVARAISLELLDVGAIKIRPNEPFKWASGWNSPIYCDNRLALSFPETRTIIKHYLADVIRSTYPDAQGIAGVATAGIPQGALVAESLDLPFMYVRSKPKGHGMENLVEGKIEKGQKIVMVEDLVSTGGSSIKAAEAIKAAGAEVLGMAAIFTYGFDVAHENFKKAEIKLVCLSDYTHLLDEALAKKLIQPDELETLSEWRENPSEWGR
ncbi:orotate phosphoribosyltransferase [Marivirga arenosa]|uniref:Orotate phosphoribosyltransferase n=1 Tax=Marivirga arenosa TaxID=3059076 RepID=A0AA52EZK2_9BACT|nr:MULTISPECIES: orotate phosphoribosyltransferase [unclassified Marivirga]WKK83481.1 orotate phosphoribosyltransferase [Marivirga sp. ABR2-2]WNB18636.1 orotate phosphoribosyltransferase [Marivirga sp. BKB1-2]